jgi:GH24 family phage-related lysozyme (muramidase)
MDLPARRARPAGKSMSSNQPWTPEDEDRLRALAEAKRSVSFVAKELKRTEAAVAGWAYKLGIGKFKTRGLKSKVAG